MIMQNKSSFTPPLPVVKSRKGFTLAEVLIALVIIGIIAAITVPVIMQNTKRVEYSSRIKKFYSMLSNAATKAKADGNDWGEWAENTGSAADLTSGSTDGGKNFAQTYLTPYLIYYKTEQINAYYYIYLNDGSYFYLYKGGCIDFIFDLNGDKKPNTEGRDIFRFLYCPNALSASWKQTGMVIPYLQKSTTSRDDALTLCKSEAMYCSGLLSFDNWEFKDDYPYRL